MSNVSPVISTGFSKPNKSKIVGAKSQRAPPSLNLNDLSLMHKGTKEVCAWSSVFLRNRCIVQRCRGQR